MTVCICNFIYSMQTNPRLEPIQDSITTSIEDLRRILLPSSAWELQVHVQVRLKLYTRLREQHRSRSTQLENA